MLKWEFQYAGPADEAEEILKPISAIGAVQDDMSDVSYPIASGLASGDICGSANWAISSALTMEYNATAERALYDLYVANVAKYPELGTTAYYFHEGYATAGMQAIPSDSTAFPHREENHLM